MKKKDYFCYKKWVPEKNRIWPYFKIVWPFYFSEKNAVSPSTDARIHKSPITVNFLAWSSGVSPLGKYQTPVFAY